MVYTSSVTDTINDKTTLSPCVYRKKNLTRRYTQWGVLLCHIQTFMRFVLQVKQLCYLDQYTYLTPAQSSHAYFWNYFKTRQRFNCNLIRYRLVVFCVVHIHDANLNKKQFYLRIQIVRVISYPLIGIFICRWMV